MLHHYSTPFIANIVTAIELVGVAIITVGALWALVTFLLAIAKGERTDAVQRLRSHLGRSILVGLEFLVAADIINTVVIDMTPESVASLAAIVAIRILLSFTLEVEIDGKWPWQRAARNSGG